MSVRPAVCVAILLLVVASAACGSASDSSAPADQSGTEAHFAAYARSLFAELRRVPLDSTAQIDIGLFGDLSLSTDERVVMRQYRYRVDSTKYGPVAQMAFHVRDSLQQNVSIPVLLTFALREKAWHLEQADYHASATGVAEGDHHAPNPPAPEFRSDDALDTETPPTRLQKLLRTDFHEWIDAAIHRANSPPVD